MTYSPLTDEIRPPTGRYRGGPKWSPRPSGGRIRGLNVHHWAGTGLSGLRRLIESSDPASANYLILTDGTLIGSVDERYRAWTTSSYAADADKITVEIQNSSGAPHWRISDAAMSTLVALYRDLGSRYGFPTTRANLRGHQEYGVATACPGPYLLPRLDDVARRASLGATPVSKPIRGPQSAGGPSRLAVDGWWGSATTRRLQEALGTMPDGIVSSQEDAWRARNPGLTTGWDWTARRPRGSQAIRAHQELLRSRGLYLARLDGLLGPQYVRALQADLHTTADGVISARSRAVMALQERLNEGKI